MREPLPQGPRGPRHAILYDRKGASQVLTSGGRPLRWRCQSCGMRFATRRGDEKACTGPTVVELPSKASCRQLLGEVEQLRCADCGLGLDLEEISVFLTRDGRQLCLGCAGQEPIDNIVRGEVGA